MSYKLAIDSDTLSSLADATRHALGSFDRMTVVEMAAREAGMEFTPCDTRERAAISYAAWARPAGWPDLDAIAAQEEGDYVLMTYDASHEASAISLYVATASGKVTVDVGHVESGAFVVDETSQVNSATVFTRWLGDLSGYVVVRITGNLTIVKGRAATDGDGRVMQYRQQPVLERVARMSKLTNLASDNSSTWGFYTLQRDKVVSDGTSLTTLNRAWEYSYSLRSLDVSGLYTPKVTNMGSAFLACIGLTGLDLRHWDVAKVTTFASAFSGCRGLEYVDITGWDTSAATSMASMFQDCFSLREIRGTLDTSKCTTIASLFSNCRSLLSVPTGTMDVVRVTTFASVFYSCYNLRELDLSGWDMQASASLSSTFAGCRRLRRLRLPSGRELHPTSCYATFSGCYALQELDVSMLHLTSACTSMASMFSNCYSLRELDISDDWDLTGIGSGTYAAQSIFAECRSLESITGIADWHIGTQGNASSIFSGCYSLRELDVSGWDISGANNVSSMFANCYSLRELDLSGWNPVRTTTLASMFANCHSLESIGDISEWTTSSVTTMASMFTECHSLKEAPDITGWDLSKVTTTASMFNGCMALTEVDYPDLSLPALTTCATMFRYCYGLRRADLSGWSMPKLATAPGVFIGDCWSLKDVMVPAFALNHSFTNDVSLSKESVIGILEGLPRVTTTRTINLTSLNLNRLSAAEKAIATAKGWSVVS